MVNKQINFLCGLPRAGNTLFSSILNQNPKIGVTAHSVVEEVCKGMELLKNDIKIKNFPYHDSFDNMCSNVMNSYYQNWDYDYIIDRGNWGSPESLNFLKNYLGQEIKIIVLVRDVHEILASLLKHSHEQSDSFVNTVKIDIGGTKSPVFLSSDEQKCDMLMGHGGMIPKILSAISNLMQSFLNNIHIVEYDDLVNNPKQTIDSVYEFLNIPSFKHNFKKFEQFSIQGQYYDDSIVGRNLHVIKETGLSKTEHKPLPQNILNKYSNLNFWRKIDSTLIRKHKWQN